MQRETEDEEQEKTLKGRVMKNVLMRADSSGVLSSTHTLYLNTHTHTHTHTHTLFLLHLVFFLLSSSDDVLRGAPEAAEHCR